MALEIKSDYAEAHNNLGIALARTGKMIEAIAHFREALWIRPDYKEAYNNLQVALTQNTKTR
jgi:Flp pilus assembly protein TadD